MYDRPFSGHPEIKCPAWPQYRQRSPSRRVLLSSGVRLARPTCMGSGSPEDRLPESIDTPEAAGDVPRAPYVSPAVSLECEAGGGWTGSGGRGTA